MNCKEDLIGTEWKCPQCKGIEVITKDGIVHSCCSYYTNKRLDMLWNDHLAYEELKQYQYKFLYNELVKDGLNKVVEENKDKLPTITKHSDNCYTINTGTLENGRSMIMTVNKQGLKEFDEILKKRTKDYGK
jgi:hypothetical protein